MKIVNYSQRLVIGGIYPNLLLTASDLLNKKVEDFRIQDKYEYQFVREETLELEEFNKSLSKRSEKKWVQTTKLWDLEKRNGRFEMEVDFHAMRVVLKGELL